MAWIRTCKKKIINLLLPTAPSLTDTVPVYSPWPLSVGNLLSSPASKVMSLLQCCASQWQTRTREPSSTSNSSTFVYWLPTIHVGIVQSFSAQRNHSSSSKQSAWVIARLRLFEHLWCDLRLWCLALRWWKDLKLQATISNSCPKFDCVKKNGKFENDFSANFTRFKGSVDSREEVSDLKCLSVSEWKKVSFLELKFYNQAITRVPNTTKEILCKHM